MKKTFQNFKGLYGEHQTRSFPNFIHHESLETRSKMYDWEITEHLHTDLYQLFIIESGGGTLISENQEFAFESPCIIMIPTNTLHGFLFQSIVGGEVITFSESFLDNLFKNYPNILMGVNHLKQLSFVEDKSTFDQLVLVKDQIIKEILEENPEKTLFVQSLFSVLFISLYRIGIHKTTNINQSDNRTLRYFQAFQKSVKLSLQELKSINEYAKELNITAVHLNRICQSLVQKSALQIVHDYLIAEAKKYLLNTNYSISEVSYLLNFKDPAYFTRLFKKQTGVSPSEFRK